MSEPEYALKMVMRYPYAMRSFNMSQVREAADPFIDYRPLMQLRPRRLNVPDTTL